VSVTTGENYEIPDTKYPFRETEAGSLLFLQNIHHERYDCSTFLHRSPKRTGSLIRDGLSRERRDELGRDVKEDAVESEKMC
jgi:hypothetical protein